MVHHPYKYAELLKQKIERHGVTCWLGQHRLGGRAVWRRKRISIRYTRALLNAALSGRLDKVRFTKDPVFGL